MSDGQGRETLPGTPTSRHPGRRHRRARGASAGRRSPGGPSETEWRTSRWEIQLPKVGLVDAEVMRVPFVNPTKERPQTEL